MRRSLPLVLAACLLTGALAGTVDAKPKKKKKKKPPVTFTATGSFAAANPGTLEGAGVTQNEFIETCAIPASQGVDGYVIELPEKVSKVMSSVTAVGGDASGIYDLDMYFYDENCASAGAASEAGDNETGAMAPGTKYVLVTAFWGVQVDFEFKSVELR